MSLEIRAALQQKGLTPRVITRVYGLGGQDDFEEDALSPVKNRKVFDYIIGSHHYIKVNDKYFPVDLSFAEYKKALAQFNNNVIAFSERYYSDFCDYIIKFRPNIIGHFDLITKFDEKDANLLLENKGYNKIAEDYLKKALKSECFFEVNTGVMARGHRTKPYPAENLLRIIKNEGGKVILSSDAHNIDKLDFAFKETEKYLKDIGFKHTYILYKNEFIKQELL